MVSSLQRADESCPRGGSVGYGSRNQKFKLFIGSILSTLVAKRTLLMPLLMQQTDCTEFSASNSPLLSLALPHPGKHLCCGSPLHHCRLHLATVHTRLQQLRQGEALARKRGI